MGRADRFPDLLDYLASRPEGATARQIAEHLRMARESVHRLLGKAPERGFPLDRNGPRYLLPSPDREPRLRPVPLTASEIRWLTHALDAPARRSPALRRVLDKLRASQGDEAARHFQPRPFLHIAHQDEWEDGLLDHLESACHTRHTLDLTYRNSIGETEQFLFDPYGIVVRRDHFYLVGHSHAPQHAPFEVIKLRLDAILHAPKTRDTFPNPQFDLSTYTQRDFGLFSGDGPPVLVRLHVDHARAHAVARTIRHPSQVCEGQPDGSMICTLTVPLSPDLVWWVANFGGGIRVLEPPALRQRVLEHGRAVTEAHILYEENIS